MKSTRKTCLRRAGDTVELEDIVADEYRSDQRADFTFM